MDTLYICDIPSDYHYAVFSSDYITLYNQPSAQNQTLHYYRLYDSSLGYYYSQGDQSFGQYNRTYFTDVPVSNDWLYRHDLDSIFICVFICVLFFIFLFNIMTSCVKKGGLFGGLL